MGKRVWSPNVPRALLFGAARIDRAIRRKGAKLTPDRARYMSHPDWTSATDRAVPPDLWEPGIETQHGLAETAQWYERNGWF